MTSRRVLLPALLAAAAGAAQSLSTQAGNTFAISTTKYKFDNRTSYLCTDATGQSAHVCAMVGEGYLYGSGADLISSVRFTDLSATQAMNVNADGMVSAAISTDENLRGFLADYILTAQRSTSRLGNAKRITGNAQVDLYLCGDDDCSTMADLLNVVSADDPGANSTLAFGYSRIAGAAVRLFGGAKAANWDLSNLLIGNYLTAGGQCVTIITFKHRFMADMGWEKASSCENILKKNKTEGNGWYDRVQDFADLIQENGGDRGATLDAGPDLFEYGRTLYCDSKHYENKQTMPAGESTCYAASHRASIAAWEVSEPALEEDPTALHLRLSHGDWWNGYAYLGPDAAKDTGSNPVQRGLRRINPLLKLSELSHRADRDDLPWCSTAKEKFDEQHKFGFVQVDGKFVDWRTCDNWGALNWGTVDTPVDDVRAAQPLSEALHVSWANVSYVHTRTYRGPEQVWKSTNDGIGFTSYEYPIPGTLVAGVETVLLDAETVLGRATDAALANSDFTTTIPGALFAMALSVTGLVAAYAGRKDIIYCFYHVGVRAHRVWRWLRLPWRTQYPDSKAREDHRNRMGLLLSKLLTMVTFVFAIITPALLAVVDEFSVRDQNSDGSVSTVVWVEAEAQGQGEYKVVAAVSLFMTSARNDAAFGLLCCNLVLAALGCVATCRVVYLVGMRDIELMRANAANGGSTFYEPHGGGGGGASSSTIISAARPVHSASSGAATDFSRYNPHYRARMQGKAASIRTPQVLDEPIWSRKEPTPVKGSPVS
ncbi:hypothetical protein JKP88DRAFT_352498 [Tribonema minus]|uniref:Uncharacterized protein n=1 Tax=Tribonema minus TaxID=303371 RepID=A0A836CMJ6_9STRA|nr:hypothetical protein JKP88DRAFT_352498 [Tribonema minus]